MPSVTLPINELNVPALPVTWPIHLRMWHAFVNRLHVEVAQERVARQVSSARIRSAGLYALPTLSVSSTNVVVVCQATVSACPSVDKIMTARAPKSVPWECARPVVEPILIARLLTPVSTVAVLVSVTRPPLAVPTPNAPALITVCSAPVSTDWLVTPKWLVAILRQHAQPPANVYLIRNASEPCADPVVQMTKAVYQIRDALMAPVVLCVTVTPSVIEDTFASIVCVWLAAATTTIALPIRLASTTSAQILVAPNPMVVSVASAPSVR